MSEVDDIGHTGSTPMWYNQASLVGMVKDVRTLAQEALNQNVAPPVQLGEANGRAAQIAEANKVKLSKSVRELVQEALNQTMANPILSIARFGKTISGGIPIMQKLSDSASALKLKMEALRDSIETMKQGYPINEFLSEMREKVMAELRAINAIIDDTEFRGNRPLSEEGKPIQIALLGGSFIEIETVGLELHAAEEDLETKEDFGALLPNIQEKLNLLSNYQRDLMQQFGQLESELRQGEAMLDRDIEMDLKGINTTLVAETVAMASGEAVSLAMNGPLNARRVNALLLAPTA